MAETSRVDTVFAAICDTDKRIYNYDPMVTLARQLERELLACQELCIERGQMVLDRDAEIFKLRTV